MSEADPVILLDDEEEERKRDALSDGPFSALLCSVHNLVYHNKLFAAHAVVPLRRRR